MADGIQSVLQVIAMGGLEQNPRPNGRDTKLTTVITSNGEPVKKLFSLLTIFSQRAHCGGYRKRRGFDS
jgi:hypothetical protein